MQLLLPCTPTKYFTLRTLDDTHKVLTEPHKTILQKSLSPTKHT